MRDYLQAHAVEFDDRNIRQSEAAREELRERSSDLIVPLLVFRDREVVGFEPHLIDEIIADYMEMRAV